MISLPTITAKDVMTTDVVSAKPNTSIVAIAKLLIERRISSVPVVDDQRRVVGLVSEEQLVRPRQGERIVHRSWWLVLLTSPEAAAKDYLESHCRQAEDVMSRDIMVVRDSMPLRRLIELLAMPRIKHLPVVREDRLVGIVSRVDLLRVLARA